MITEENISILRNFIEDMRALEGAPYTKCIQAYLALGVIEETIDAFNEYIDMQIDIVTSERFGYICEDRGIQLAQATMELNRRHD